MTDQSDTITMSIHQLLDLLSDGELEVKGQFRWGSNYTFLATITDGDVVIPAVYKPCAGESPLWDFDRATLCRREVAAYLLSEHLGWPAVPPTVLRDGPHGPGSVQLFIDADPNEHFFSLRDRGGHELTFQQIVLFDALTNNADRKGGHLLLAQDGQVWAIDHGLTFHTEPKLRSVIWDYAKEAIPAGLLADLNRLNDHLQPGTPLLEAMTRLLSARETQAVQSRLHELLNKGHFPSPGPGRNVPYPLV